MTMSETMVADRRSTTTDVDLARRVQDLYARYAETICDDDLEAWPDFFVDECVYRIWPRVNRDRALPVALILSESRGGLIDRVAAIRNTMVFGPRYVSHTISNVRIVEQDDGVLTTRSMFTVYQTFTDQLTDLLMVGRTFDKIDAGGAQLKFIERIVVPDSQVLSGTIVYPI